jgi:hypothetical protein
MIWKKREAVFTYLPLGGVAGMSPAERASGKVLGFEAGAFPLYFLWRLQFLPLII